MTEKDDWIRARVKARAAELQLTSYAIAQATAGEVSEDHVAAYLAGRKSMTSARLQHVLHVLRLSIADRPIGG